MAAAYMFLQSWWKKRTFKTIEVLCDYDDQFLIERYRLDRHIIENVCELVRGDLERPTKRNKAVSVSFSRLEKFVSEPRPSVTCSKTQITVERRDVLL